MDEEAAGGEGEAIIDTNTGGFYARRIAGLVYTSLEFMTF